MQLEFNCCRAARHPDHTCSLARLHNMTCSESGEGMGGWVLPSENNSLLVRTKLKGQKENLQCLRNFTPQWNLSEDASLAIGSQCQRRRKEARPQPSFLTHLDTKDQEADLKQKLPTQQRICFPVSVPHSC